MEHFNFTKKERNGTFALLLLIILFTTIPFILPFFIKKENYNSKKIDTAIATLKLQQTDSAQQHIHKGNYLHYETATEQKPIAHLQAEIFYFDPNTLSVEGWKKLGIRDKTILTIKKYLSKGGKFYKPEDISKIWGIRKEEADRIIPFIKIENSTTHPSYFKNDNTVTAYTPNKKEIKQLIDINTADTTLFIALPGIAGKLANRIITFRNKLGGFYKIDQIAETFGLRDSVFQLIKPLLIISNTPLAQFNINTATVDEMKQHPYIHYAIANGIVQYRNQHGTFSSVADVKKITLVTDDIFNKMAPYLKTN